MLQVAATLEAYVDLVQSRLPMRYYPGEQFKAPWRYVGLAQVSRFTECARSCAVLLRAGQLVDAVALSRVLYDHVVTFCWVHIDPEINGRWLFDWTNYETRRLGKDMLRYSDEPLPDVPDGFPQPRQAQRLDERALQADAHWSSVDSLFRANVDESAPANVLTLRGLYSVVFRVASQEVHASSRPVEQCVKFEKEQRVVVSRPEEPPRTSIVVPASVMGLGLIAAHHVLGWPARDDIVRIHDNLVMAPTTVEATPSDASPS